jgi:hypothetical protein
MMDSFQLPEAELAEMKEFYLEEYDRVSRRLIHIMAVLKRLGVEIPDNGPDDIGTIRISRGKAGPSKRSGSPARKRSGRKSKWELLIMKRLRQLDKPVTYDELTDEIMAFSKLPAEKRDSTKQAVVNVIFRLRNRDRKLNTFSAGTREKYIALRSWFETSGEIKKEYMAKIKVPKPAAKTKRRKTGRPRKKS